jgi:ABC-type transport system involved in multi-copper enzyme maturation permease subunit
MFLVRLAWIQGLLIVLLLPGLVATSIAEEDRRRTMFHLLASPLSSAAILTGKLGARLLPAAEMLAAGVPFVAPLWLLGLVDWATLWRVYGLLLVLVAFTAFLSLLVSTLVRQPRRAVVIAYLLVGFWFLSPIFLSQNGMLFSAVPGLAGWLNLTHPIRFYVFSYIPVARLGNDLMGVAWARAAAAQAWPWFLSFHLGASAVSFALAALCLRPLRLGHWRHVGAQNRPLRPNRYEDARAGRALDGNPLLWREWHFGKRPPTRVLLCVAAGLVHFGLPLVESAGKAFGEYAASWKSSVNTTWRREQLNEQLRQANAGLFVVALIAVTVLASTSVTGERELGTWAQLAATEINGREFATAKVVGSLRSGASFGAPFLMIWAIGLGTGSVHPIGVMAAALALIMFAWCAAALGVLVSVFATNSGQSILVTLLALVGATGVFLLFIPLDLIGPLAPSWRALNLAGVPPFVEWIALASPMDIDQTWQRMPRDARFGIPGLGDFRVVVAPGLVRTYLVSLIGHGAAAAAFTWLAAVAFEVWRGGAPRVRCAWKAGNASMETPTRPESRRVRVFPFSLRWH